MKNTANFLYRKIIPLFIAAIVFLQCGPAALAQQYTAVQDNTRVERKVVLTLNKTFSQAEAATYLSYNQAKAIIAKEYGKNLTEEEYQQLYYLYLKTVSDDDRQVAAVYKSLSAEINLDGYLSYAFKKAGGKESFCEGKTCYELKNYVQGFLRARLHDAAGQRPGTAERFKWNAEIMLAAIPDIYTAFYNYGIHPADAAFLQKYLRFLVKKTTDYCDNDFYLADIAPGAAGADGRGKAVRGKAARQEQCQSIAKAMFLLGISSESGEDKIENSAIIYKAAKDTFKDDYGAITLPSAVAALIAVNTKGAYVYIETLLTKDTLKAAQNFGTVKNGLFWFLDLLSIQAWIEKGTDTNNRSRGRGGRFLNPVTAAFQYIDEEAAAEWGISSFSISVAKTNPSLGYNVPYRNVFEDIGIMIASTGTVEGNNLAKNIIAAYAAALKENGNASRAVHTPLAAGILQTGAVKTSEAAFAAKQMNALDWWDLNEATQRRINNLTSKYSGTVLRSPDQAKIKRNEQNQKIIQAGVWTDMLVSAVLVATMVASLPNIVRSAAKLSSNIGRIRAINAAGKANLLRITRANIASLPVKPAQIKTALAARAKAPVKTTIIKAEVKTPAVKIAKPQKPISGQIQYALTEKGAPALLTADRTALSATVGEGGGGAAYTKAVQKAKTVISANKATPQKILQSIEKPFEPAVFKPAVSVAEQRAVLFKNRTFLEKAVFGNKFFNELSPIKKNLLVGKIGLSVYGNLFSDVMVYGLKNSKLFPAAAMIPAAQIALPAPAVAITKTISAMPSAVKTITLENSFTLAKGPVFTNTAQALKIPFSKPPVRLPPLIAVSPRDMILAAIPGASFSNRAAIKPSLKERLLSVFDLKSDKPLTNGPQVLRKKRVFANLKKQFNAKYDDDAFRAMSSLLFEQHPAMDNPNFIYRGLFLSYASDIKEIAAGGMDIARIIPKPLATHTRDAMFEVLNERSNMCFAAHPQGAMSYATGMNMFNSSRKGFITMVVARRPQDLNTDGIWYLSRSMKADEIEGIFIFNAETNTWLTAEEVIASLNL